MPDTMIQAEAIPVQSPASCGVMEGFRSASIGKLVSARAKASSKIKSIIKDKKAKIESRKEGGRAFEYAYADLADVLEAIEEAISEQGLAILQTTQSRREGTFLLTTLAHESDQWVSSEIRLRNTEGGPQVLGSELTYLRRYSVLSILALAPEQDDDGKAAQQQADQQARQRPVQQPEQPRRSNPTPPPSKAILAAPNQPEHMPMQYGPDGAFVGRWTKQALEILKGRDEQFRRTWLELHVSELEEVRITRQDYADKVEAACIAPDLPVQAAAE